MTHHYRDLNLTDPANGYLHFVVQAEARLGVARSLLNAEVSLAVQTPFLQEWVARLVRCEPNALHCAIVEPRQIPTLFHPCIEEDGEASPVAADCVCRKAMYDPEFGLPVVVQHANITGSADVTRWIYRTFAPLALRPHDSFGSLIVDRDGSLWVRTGEGILSLLPQSRALGYDFGYDGGGPHALAAYLSQVAATDGQVTAAGAPYARAHPAILAWTQSSAVEQGARELTLIDLKEMRRS
ncbi:hypothetical protein [Streptomyces sp. NPDC056549]|uniref:hypothetical protein n=1 Tax=Streptomyces sp. NPDC056549 TaxID=3345864 RepID=UPI00368EB5E8